MKHGVREFLITTIQQYVWGLWIEKASRSGERCEYIE